MRKPDFLDDTVTLEGVLFLPDALSRMLSGNTIFETAADYAVPKGLELKNELSRFWSIASALQASFAGTAAGQGEADAHRATEEFVTAFLRDVLQFRIDRSDPLEVEGRTYPLAWRASGLPLVIAPCTESLETASPVYAAAGGSASKQSPFQLAQAILNVTPGDAWGLVSNGLRLRLLRKSSSLTRPGYLEFDLEAILNGGRYAEFCRMWRVMHGSRAGVRDGLCIWEHWARLSADEGRRARETMNYNVVKALTALGLGFMRHPENEPLRRAMREGTLTADGFMRELLRLLYRFIFLFCLEERDLLLSKGDSPELELARARYKEGYSLHRFRDICLARRVKNFYSDAWESVGIVFEGLSEGKPEMALPALGGLFAEDRCPHLTSSKLDNAAFYEAMGWLRWDTAYGRMSPIDYKNLGSEELGSVYESLLELVPVVNTDERFFGFVGLRIEGLKVEGSDAGNARKSTGSYYTPDSLVQKLLDTTLDPVIEKTITKARQKGEDVEAALLSLKVIDPSLGSGHFALGAARRIAAKLASLRSFGAAPDPAVFRHALHQVIERCIYGVDLNPLAVELARMALWLEGYEEGKPLSFLDHHICVGNSLLGIFREEDVLKGISKKAFDPKRGDDKAVCRRLAERNAGGLAAIRGHLGGQTSFAFGGRFRGLAEKLRDVEALRPTTVSGVERQSEAYRLVMTGEEAERLRKICNVCLAAFMAPKTPETENLIPTSATLNQLLFDENAYEPNFEEKIAYAEKVCRRAKVFHWVLAFPQVFEKGGISAVASNPPWEKMKVEDEKWFATRCPEIANAPKADVRKKRIRLLELGMLAKSRLLPDQFVEEILKGKTIGELLPPKEAADYMPSEEEQALHAEYIEAQRQADCAVAYCHQTEKEGGRFPLTGKGDTNLYAYFAELAESLITKDSTARAGLVIPTGILTDNATQAFAAKLLGGRLVSLYDFENREKFFQIDSRYRFALVTIGEAEQADCVFYAHNLKHLDDERRHVRFTADDIQLMNPNTGTSPIMRSVRDLEINRKIYGRVPVLWKEEKVQTDETGEEKVVVHEKNPWGVKFFAMFHMTNDSGEFSSAPSQGWVPLFEGKLIHQFDDRFATYVWKNGRVSGPKGLEAEDKDRRIEITPRYWVPAESVTARFHEKSWNKPWLVGFRDIASATNERTLIATALPVTFGYGNKLPLMLPSVADEKNVACLLV